MTCTIRRVNALRTVCALALLAPLALTTARASAPSGQRAEATAFIHELAAGKFAQAETRFNSQMREQATPQKLKGLWQFMQKHFGPYAKTTGADKTNFQGHPMIIVHTVFKRQTVGLAVFFDHAQKISGLRVVPLQ